MESFYRNGSYTYDPLPVLPKGVVISSALELHARMAIVADSYGCAKLRHFAMTAMKHHGARLVESCKREDRSKANRLPFWKKLMMTHVERAAWYVYGNELADDQEVQEALVGLLTWTTESERGTCVDAMANQGWVDLAARYPRFVADVVLFLGSSGSSNRPTGTRLDAES